MIGDRRVLAVVPARGGSKGVPRKNIRPVAGKPLLAYTVEAAICASTLDRIVVSSEDREILELAADLGVEPLPRPAELATDTATGDEVLLHAIEAVPGYDYVVLLQPTSPLRRAEDIDAAVNLCQETGAPLCVSVSIVEKSPWWMFTVGDEGRLKPLLPGPMPSRRQDSPEVLMLNGAVYVASVTWLRGLGGMDYTQAVPYCMPASRSLDVDTEDDLRRLESILAESNST